MAAAKFFSRAAWFEKRPPLVLKVSIVRVAHRSDDNSGVSSIASPGQLRQALAGDSKRKKKKRVL